MCVYTWEVSTRELCMLRFSECGFPHIEPNTDYGAARSRCISNVVINVQLKCFLTYRASVFELLCAFELRVSTKAA